MCNLSNLYSITTQENAEASPFGNQGGIWRTVPLSDNADPAPRKIEIYTGLGWYIFFVRTRRGEICPLYARNEKGEELPLGETNVLTAHA